jgi:hypothetical protein
MLALFNKNKQLIGYAPNISEDNSFQGYHKEIPLEFSNLKEWHWEGDFDNGKMVSNRKIIELDNEAKALKEIIEKYPLGIQITNIIRQLHLISKNANLFNNDFKEMSTDVLDILSKYNK